MHKNYKKLPPFLTAALCAMLLCSCAPALRAPQPTTAAPYEEESSADYEQLTESSLKEQQRFADFEENLFQDEISASRLDLHFLLKSGGPRHYRDRRADCPHLHGSFSADTEGPGKTAE